MIDGCCSVLRGRDLCKPCRDKSETLGCAVAGGAVGVTYGSFGLCLPISCLAKMLAIVGCAACCCIHGACTASSQSISR